MHTAWSVSTWIWMDCFWFQGADLRPVIGLNFLHVVQIRYCNSDITHTVRKLAGTQWYFVSAVSLLQIPLQISARGSLCLWTDHLWGPHRKKRWTASVLSTHINRHTDIHSSLYPSFPAIIFPSICHVSRALQNRPHTHTLGPFTRSNWIFFVCVCNCCSNLYCQVFVWIGGAFGAFTVTDRQSHHASYSQTDSVQRDPILSPLGTYMPDK